MDWRKAPVPAMGIGMPSDSHGSDVWRRLHPIRVDPDGPAHFANELNPVPATVLEATSAILSSSGRGLVDDILRLGPNRWGDLIEQRLNLWILSHCQDSDENAWLHLGSHRPMSDHRQAYPAVSELVAQTGRPGTLWRCTCSHAKMMG